MAGGPDLAWEVEFGCPRVGFRRGYLRLTQIGRPWAFSTVSVFNISPHEAPQFTASKKSHLHLTRSSDQLPGRTPRRNLVYEVLKSPHWMQQYQNQGSAHSVPVSSLLQTAIQSVFATLQFCRPCPLVWRAFVFMVLRIAFPATPLF